MNELYIFDIDGTRVTLYKSVKLLGIHTDHKCGALCDLVPSVQFKKREKHLWRSANVFQILQMVPNRATHHKLSFDEHVSPLCKKASNQLNAISKLHRYLGFKEKETLNNSFAHANFNYCLLRYGISAQPSLLGKLKKYKKGT